MTFEEAEKKLAEIAGKSYFSLSFERSTRPKGYYKTDPEKTTTCSVYIHNYKWHSGPTWEDAFRKLYLEMHPEEAIEESPGV